MSGGQWFDHSKGILESCRHKRIHEQFVVLLLASLSSGVRLTMVTVVFLVVLFVIAFLPFSHYVFYQPSPSPSLFYCCSPFSSHSFQGISLRSPPIAFSVFVASFTPPLSGHLISLQVFDLVIVPHDRQISTYSSPIYF